MADISELKLLQKNCGIDFEKLKSKYSSLKQPEESTDETVVPLVNTSALDDIYICKTCTGLGIMTYVYNFQKREKNCTECSGDAVIKKTTTTAKAMREQVPISVFMKSASEIQL